MPQDHNKVGMICYDEYQNAHFTSFEDITRIYQRFSKLAINRLNKKKEESQ